MTIKEIQNIIKEFEASTLTQLELETKDVKIKLSKQKQNEVIENVTLKNEDKSVSYQKEQKEIVDNKNEIGIKSPLVGTYFAQLTPEAKPFVQVGQKVKKGDVVCIIEAMKIMNEITSPFTGVVKSLHVNNKDVIGYDQELMTIGEIVEK